MLDLQGRAPSRIDQSEDSVTKTIVPIRGSELLVNPHTRTWIFIESCSVGEGL